MILGVIRVAGSSLSPAYEDGDYVIVSSLPFRFAALRPGDAVVYRHPGGGKRIKLVERLEDGGRKVFVVGLSPDSQDSRMFGPVPVELVLARVIARIPKK